MSSKKACTSCLLKTHKSTPLSRHTVKSMKHIEDGRRTDYSSITTVRHDFSFSPKLSKTLTSTHQTPIPCKVCVVSYLCPPHWLCVFQYYHSVRVFAGQDPSCVWVGWVTPDYHYYSNNFNLSKNRTVTVTLGDERGRVHERYTHPSLL